MNDHNFTVSITVDKTPEEVYKAVNDPRGWWSKGILGDTDKVGAVFYYQYENMHHCTIQVTELQPGKKVVWHVLRNDFDFTKEKTELTNTDIIFDIEQKGDKTELTFTHVGLTPALECHEICSGGWSGFVLESLRDLITKGQGQPNQQ